MGGGGVLEGNEGLAVRGEPERSEEGWFVGQRSVVLEDWAVVWGWRVGKVQAQSPSLWKSKLGGVATVGS